MADPGHLCCQLIALIVLMLTGCRESLSTTNEDSGQKSFAIDYENDGFLLDGRPFRYVSGSFHYFRAPRSLWGDRLRKIRAAGLNAVSTYVEWSTHQPEPDRWRWDGEADLEEFLRLAQQEDLLVLLRPGPYICAERDFGGLPYWLLGLEPDLKIRTSDPKYLRYAEEYWHRVLQRVQRLLRGNGGPIIMVQIENEYGSFYACDHNYTSRLAEIARRYVGEAAVLYTTDGSYRDALKCGPVPGVFATVDFGSRVNATEAFALMRSVQPKGPLVNSEFYPGWLSHWGEQFQRVPRENVTRSLNTILEAGASVNIYMFNGGTNFGFSSGANIFGSFQPDLTSYDYDAPLSEAGDPTDKYFDIRDLVSQYLPKLLVESSEEAPPAAAASPKGNYGQVRLRSVMYLFDLEARRLYGTAPRQGELPPTLEALEAPCWLALYETETRTRRANDSRSESVLEAVPRDRALVYVGGRLAGTLRRERNETHMRLPGARDRTPQTLQVLLESQGRVNFGNVDVEDAKGLFNVSVDGLPIYNWTTTGFAFSGNVSATDWPRSSSSSSSRYGQDSPAETGTLLRGPQILLGEFDVPEKPSPPLDSFLNTAGWGKGVAWVNGHNLGRYWPLAGPQLTLYVPGSFLRPGRNRLMLVELEYLPDNRTMSFQPEPILDYPSLSLQRR